jgi:hypothetical protein
MNCRKIEELLPLYASGDASKRKSRRIGLHIEACPRCRAAFESFLALRVQLRELREEPPEGTLDGFFDELAPRLSAPLAPASRSRVLPFLTWRGASVAAASLLVAVLATISLGVWTGSPGGSDPGKRFVDPRGGPRDPMEDWHPEPYNPIATVSEATAVDAVAAGGVRVTPLRILAGPRVSVPLEPPALPVTSPIPRVQPYPGLVPSPTPADYRVH